MSHMSNIALPRESKALGYTCVSSWTQAQGVELRLDSQKHDLPTSIFAANPGVGT